MAPHSSTLAWKISWMEEPGGLQSMGLLRVGHGWATSLSLFTFMHWRRKWRPTPVFLPGESQRRGSLVGCRLWGRTGSDTTEATSQQQLHSKWGFPGGASHREVSGSCSVVSNSATMGCTVHRILQARITRVGSLSLLQGIFPAQGLNPGLLHCRKILYSLRHQGILFSSQAWSLSDVDSSDLSSDFKVINGSLDKKVVIQLSAPLNILHWNVNYWQWCLIF